MDTHRATTDDDYEACPSRALGVQSIFHLLIDCARARRQPLGYRASASRQRFDSSPARVPAPGRQRQRGDAKPSPRAAQPNDTWSRLAWIVVPGSFRRVPSGAGTEPSASGARAAPVPHTSGDREVPKQLAGGIGAATQQHQSSLWVKYGVPLSFPVCASA